MTVTTKNRSSVRDQTDAPASGGAIPPGWATIERIDEMPPFLMTLVTDSDLWLYLSSHGGLTCGRVSADLALFPYETDDRLHVSSGHTGGITLVRAGLDGRETLWRPLDPRGVPAGAVRSLSRTLLGDRVRFQETHEPLGLRFSVEWALSDEYGVVRTCELTSLRAEPVEVDLLDGLLNVLPAGVDAPMQRSVSTLVDAYKMTELDGETSMAIFALDARISDRAEPAESLLANVVWRSGLDDAAVHLDAAAIDRFARGERLDGATLSTGQRGNYLCSAKLGLAPGASETWTMCGDVGLDQPRVVALRRALRRAGGAGEDVRRTVDESSARLERLLAMADARQLTEDAAACAAHHSSVLFNCMRGGLIPGGYTVDTADFRAFVRSRNRRLDGALGAVGELATLGSLRDAAEASGDADLIRLVLEYLPLTFGRRHGDPSRPWNSFAIQLRHRDGSRMLDYQGNWRDIFQNWEALCRSYPAYLPNVIAKFVNASTADGFNAYRISRDGIDWERPDPSDPWANIGYWGDHQIVYLLRLLEQLRDTSPGELEAFLARPIFSYANVPYRIRPYDAIVADGKETIEFDHALDEEITRRVAELGADGRLLLDAGGRVLRVTLVEKLLVPALAKLSNLVPGGGIWLNTQRPEWNDANNAIVGNGLSMVTLHHIRRYAAFCVEALAPIESESPPVSGAVAEWADAVASALREHAEEFGEDAEPGDDRRRALLDRLGRAFGRYRERLYGRGVGEPAPYPVRSVVELFRLAVRACDHAIRVSRRPDGLAHSYNVMELSEAPQAARVGHLGLMLEGQVSLLSAGVLDASESASIIESMFESPLLREDLGTFMLYPIVERPRFLDRNVVDPGAVASNPLAGRLVDTGRDGILTRDEDGAVRFSCDYKSARDLSAALDGLADDPQWRDDVAEHRSGLLGAYEAVFRHIEFTGRSGTMHKYEGIGCIYWHMVAKLLLAAQETYFERAAAGDDPADLRRLARAYHRVRDGIGFNRTAREFGAFSHEPYSHTPLHCGAQQPGMTGQAKESILARFGELGVRLSRGTIVIDPALLRASEFTDRPESWRVETSTGAERRVDVPAGSVAFTYCGAPFVLTLADSPRVTVRGRDGRSESFEGSTIPAPVAARIFARSPDIEAVAVDVDRAAVSSD